jgi:predicted amidohydrolase YtcJ
MDYANFQTRVIDLQGKMVIPGLLDTHLHPPGLSLLELYEVQLSHSRTLAECVGTVADYIARNPNTTAVYGRGWSWNLLKGEEQTKGPRKEHLDAVSTTVPIILRASDGHTLWLNSKAMTLNGIHAETPVPAGGSIEKDAVSGDLWGTFKESAMSLIALPEYTLEQYTDALLSFQNKMHRLGITGILCLGSLSFELLFKAFSAIEQTGRLQLHIRGAMTIHAKEPLEKQYTHLNALRQQYATRDLQISSVKFFTDGVVEGGTSCLLRPYAAKAGKGPGYCGDFLWEPSKLQQAFSLANRNRFSIHVHSTGDGSTKKVLDALEESAAETGTGDFRNAITHLQLVAPEDIPRFRKLNVIASVQPYWHFKGPGWWQEVDYAFLGERAEAEFPLATFFANGVTVAASSDYPATLLPNPLLAIETGVTRNLPDGTVYAIKDIENMDDETYLLNRRERATVRQMLRSFTINGARLLGLDKEIGSVEPGKLADLVVLDRNLLTINPLEIGSAQVVMTFFGGKIVYHNPSSQPETSIQAAQPAIDKSELVRLKPDIETSVGDSTPTEATGSHPRL